MISLPELDDAGQSLYLCSSCIVQRVIPYLLLAACWKMYKILEIPVAIV
jgi:hypothetical protein